MNNTDNSIFRRNFMASAGILAVGSLASLRKLFDEASLVTTIINKAAKSSVAPQQLRNNLHVPEGSGGKIIAFTGREGKRLVDAGIDVSKEKIKKCRPVSANCLSNT